jgi:polyisoprenoid-binding protein YceI
VTGVGVAPLHAQTPADLAREQFDVDGMHSTIGFTARVLGVVKVRGRFRSYDVAVTYDSAHIEHSSVTAIIASKSIDTDMDFRDNHLRSPDFFDVQTFPTIQFHSDQVVAQAGGLFVSGPLTMHGVTRTVTFVATVTPLPRLGRSGNIGVELEASLRLSRAAFGIAGTNTFNPDYNPATNLLADSVDVTLELDAEREGFLDRTLGRGTPPGIGDTIAKILDVQGAAMAVAAYQTLRATRAGAFTFDASQLDVLTHMLITRGRNSDAVALARLNAGAYPMQSSVLETLGEAEALVNNREAALAAYHSAAALDPLSATAQEMLRRLAAVAR